MAAKLTREAMRAARALLGKSIQDMASAIGVGPNTLLLVERGERVRASTEAKIISALDRLGVEIVGGDVTGATLRLQPEAEA
ncbi:MAG TPA: helix-turn-helix transcriptional regulator [Phenylobacterium sp.]|nr:helix-turn-helix transcriptional regulator [Phenylobacterium sp.]